MKNKWDSIDDLIRNSFEEIETNDDYNCKLFNNLCQQEEVNKNIEKRRIAALSLILSGFMMLVLNTSSLNYKITNIKTNMKTSMSNMKYNSIGGINIENIFFGE